VSDMLLSLRVQKHELDWSFSMCQQQTSGVDPTSIHFFPSFTIPHQAFLSFPLMWTLSRR
jgi:hypothetical protein